MTCNNNSKLEYITRLEKHTEHMIEPRSDAKKYFVTFPYPYMNGKLHLGHLYSLSKADFMAYYKRLCGYNVLFPFSFHCTGMPISASAKKLAEELDGKKVDLSVVEILRQFGFEDPSPFVDPNHWIRVFPECARKTLDLFHGGIDWRRSFITTELNGYYDSFIRFQFRRLRAAGLLAYGKRYSIYCRIDKQACLDHDRRRGEGVKPVEVILKKIGTSCGTLLLRCKVAEKTSDSVERIVLGCDDVFVKFSISEISGNAKKTIERKEIEDAAVDAVVEGIENIILKKRNEKKTGQSVVSECYSEIKNGEENKTQDTTVKKNISELNETVDNTLSTAVYIIEKTLYDNIVHQIDGITEISRLSDEDVKYIAEIDGISVSVIEGVGSRAVLSRKGGKQVCDEHAAILCIKNEEKRLVATNNFVKMLEPERQVISRSGDECVVSLLDQWYIDYGRSDWKTKVQKCVSKMELSAATRQKLEEGVEWISKWGFSRSFGLGTRVPWDERYLIDSLSDSTIYMSFYTFKHFLCGGLAGEDPIVPLEVLDDDFWEYIYGDVMRPYGCVGGCGDEDICCCVDEKRCNRNKTRGIKLPERLLPYEDVMTRCRESLRHFYPIDLRVSGKDLIGNHLLFFIFNHVALFREEFWPLRIFTNGHLMLNSAKMSKSEGNFMSADEALCKFGTSATRLCLASCGDTNEDANFEEENANACVLKLYTLAKKIQENKSIRDINDKKSNNDNENINVNHQTPQTYEEFIETLLSQLLSRNIRAALEAYEAMAYRDVAKYAFYESLHAVEQYFVMGGTETPFVALAYKAILQLIYPIVPSFSSALLEYKYGGELRIPEPFTDRVDAIAALDYARALINRITTGAKGKTKCTIIVSKKYPAWKVEAMRLIDMIIERRNNDKPDDLESDESLKAAESVSKERFNNLTAKNGNGNNNTSNEIKKQKAKIIGTLSELFRSYRLNVDKGLKFAMDYFKDPAKYAIVFDETAYLGFLRPYIVKHSGVFFDYEIGDSGEPMKPFILFN